MRFAENNRISHRQLYRQMILALLAPFMLCVFGKGGMNGISAVAGMIFALILLGFYVIWLIRLTPSFEDPVKSAGAFAGRLIGIFFLIYVLMAGGYLLALLRRLVPVKLITGVSGRWIAFWAVLVCSVGTCKGVQRRGRMAEVSGGLLLGGIMIMMILCVPQAKTEYLMGENPVGGAYSEKCQSVFLWNSVCFFAGCIAAVSVGKCGEIRKCGKDGGRRDPDTWRDSYWNGASASGSSGI